MSSPHPPVEGGAFPSTQWSLVLHAGADTSSQARAALELLCRLYWYPIYAFIRRQGRAHHEAEDCTQEFFARLLAAHAVGRARPERGRFRAFLLTSLRHFLANEWHKAHALKRGGDVVVCSIDEQDAERRYLNEPVDPGLTPEQAFDRAWARAMFARALGELRGEYDRSGRGDIFDAISNSLFLDSNQESLTRAAAGLGTNAHALHMALHRLRRRLGERLREYVMETLADPAEVDDELRHLIAAGSHATSIPQAAQPAG